MTDNYARIVQHNLERLYSDLPGDLAANLPARQQGDRFVFKAFGETCLLSPRGIVLEPGEHTSVTSILISLYALKARPDNCLLTPLKAFKEFPDSAPYVGAFTTHTEQPPASRAGRIKKALPGILEALDGEHAPPGTAGDFSFVVRPLPKVALCYIFYEADDEFPASVKCLFSNNASVFLPVECLADTGEYTSRKIMQLAG